MSRGPRGQQGSATVVLPLLLWTVTLVAIVTIDIGAYLVAAARAQAAADAAALAAIAAKESLTGDLPRRAAQRVTDAAGARLERCMCPRGAEQHTVAVSVEVPGLVIPHLGASRVRASASAVMVPSDLPP